MKKERIDWHTRFIDQHGDKYDYHLVDFGAISARNKIQIVCKAHNHIFTPTPLDHHRGTGCPLCAHEARVVRHKGLTRTKESYIEEFHTIHNNHYSYDVWLSSGEPYNARTKIPVECPVHGIWMVQISCHKTGNGCPMCAADKRRNVKVDVIDRANKQHGGQYDYSQWVSEYTTNTQVMDVTCPIHGEFQQTVDKHINQGTGCPACTKLTSRSEREVAEFVTSLGVEITPNDRTILNGQELDIVIPSHKLAIEYCGNFWHCDVHPRITRKFHITKTNQVESAGMQLLTIFEDEWKLKRPIVEAKIKHMLGKDDRLKVSARSCAIVDVAREPRTEFLNAYHIQGDGPGSIAFGLEHNNQLVAVAVFIAQQNGVYVLNRYATSHLVRGGLTKILTHFERMYNPVQLVSFADRRWSDGAMYEKTGFMLDALLPEDYYYVNTRNSLLRHHKFGFRHSLLKNKLGSLYDPSLTEVENCNRAGYYRLWNCGLKRYVKNYKNAT